MSNDMQPVPGSFRDPSGYVFREEGVLYRQITAAGEADFIHLVNSGLARELMETGKLVSFELSPANSMVLELEELPFITYPYEWSFGQLRDAAVLTLEIALKALQNGMILKDASAYNIAFRSGKAVFLDHTSFTVYQENTPWVAYRQFVMHFLAPLLVMQKVDVRLLSLLETDTAGIPLDLASRLLPRRTLFSPDILIHIHLHALLETRCSQKKGNVSTVSMPRRKLENMLISMLEYIRAMAPPAGRTLWADYTGDTSYSRTALESKRAAVEYFCRECPGKTAVDLGANAGLFTAILARRFEHVTAVDMDPSAVDALYGMSRREYPNVTPVLANLSTPPPGIGVFNEERPSLLSRLKGDAVMGLALIHHLRITGNWTLGQIVRLFGESAPCALVEFVPREDPQTAQLLRGREGFCPDWELEQVMAAFRKEYAVCEVVPVKDSLRVLLKLRKR